MGCWRNSRTGRESRPGTGTGTALLGVGAALLGIGAVLLAAFTLAGCPGSSSTAPEAGGAAGAMVPGARPATRTALVITGETWGWLEPCGCAEGMLGGIARRVAFVRGLAAQGALEPIVLDAGDLVQAPGPQTDMKLDALERAMRLAPLGAVALGPRDIPYRVRLGAAFGEALLAAGAPPLTLTTARAGPVRVAVALGSQARAEYEAAGLAVGTHAAGGSSTSTSTSTGTSAPSTSSVPSGTPSTPAAAPDVVLFLGNPAEARVAYGARGLPGAPALVIAGRGEESPAEERLASGTLLVTTSEKAKHALVVALERRDGKLFASLAMPPVALGGRIPDDPAAARLVEEYRQSVFAANLAEAEERKPLLVGGSFVGPETCGACHAPQYAVYLKMKHFHSFDGLIARKGTRDMECLRCHVTGAGFSSGFTSPEATPDLAHVSCESCHGVGGNHVQAMASGLGGASREGGDPSGGGRGDYGRIPEPRKLCVECHDKENSPRFDFDAYWSRIKHGREGLPPR